MMCLAAPSVAAQMWGPHAEYDRLYERLARSAFVIQGTVTGVDSIMRRGAEKTCVTPGEGSALVFDVGCANGGGVYTVEPAQIICKQQDFTPGVSQTADAPPNTIHIYMPPRIPSGSYPSMATSLMYLIPGKQYLLFLSPYLRQDELLANFELDPACSEANWAPLNCAAKGRRAGRGTLCR